MIDCRNAAPRAFPGGGGAIAVLILMVAVVSLLSPDREKPRSADGMFQPEHAFEMSSLLFEASASLAQERGLTVLALNDTEAVSQRLRSEIQTVRAKADRALSKALELGLSELPFVQDDDMIASVEGNYSRLHTLRRDVDRNIGRGKDDREPSLSSRWFAASSVFVESIGELLGEVNYQAGRGTFALDSELQLQHWAWIVGEFAGRERAVLAGALARHDALRPEVKSQLALYRTRVELAWQAMRRFKPLVRPGGAASDRMDELEDRFFGAFEKRRQAAYAALSNGNASGPTAEEWFRASSAAVDTVLEFGRAAADDYRQHWREIMIRQEAERAA